MEMQSLPIRVLLIVDDEDDYLLIADLLSDVSDLQSTLEWVADYEAALDAMERGKYDVCLLDHRMKGRSGLEPLNEAVRRGIRTPIIFLTGQGDNGLGLEAIRAGATDYLTKDQMTANLLGRSIRYVMLHNKKREELLKSQQVIQALSECNDALIHIKGEVDLLREICRIVVEVGGYLMAWVGYAEEDVGQTVTPVAKYGYEEGYLETVNVTWGDTDRGRGPTGTSIREGVPRIVHFVKNDPAFAPWKVEATNRGYLSVIGLPLFLDGRILGALTIYASEPDAFGPEEVELLIKLSGNLSYGIEALRVHHAHGDAVESLRKAYLDLERRVAERTADLVRVNAELKREKEELRESEAKYRALVETTDTGFVIIDQEGRVLDANQEYVRLTGHRHLNEILGGNVMDWTAGYQKEKNALAVRKCFEQGYARNLEIDYIDSQGKVTPIEINATVVEIRGTPQILTLCRDITERKRAEEASRTHIHFLENLELIDQAIKQETDVEKMLSNVMRTVFEIFECDRAWLFYPCDPDAPSFRVPMEISRPEYPGAKALNVEVPMGPGVAQDLRDALASDDPLPYTLGTEKTVNTVTAQQFGVQAQMFMAIYPKTGKPWVFGMHQCSYPRIWSQQEQKLFKEIGRRIADGLGSVLFLRELKENENRFRATFEQAAVGMAHVALDGRWLRVNRKLCDIVGYSRDELLQKTFQDITHPDDLDADLEYVRHVLSGEISTYSMEKRYLRKDSSVVWINLTVSIVRHASGEPEYFISVIEDITERKRAEEEREKLQGQLLQAQKIEAVGRLAGGVAHDFNNMLGVILGHTELALYQTNLDDPRHLDLQEIHKAARRSADLTRQLLAFARKQTVSPEVLDLNNTVSSMLKMLQRLIGEDIDLAWMPGHHIWSVKIDPSQVDQLLANLAINARDAITGGGKVTIETANVVFDGSAVTDPQGFAPGEYVLLAVSDNGAGMSKEVLDHIFEPFFTTKEVGKGTGLGLATVYGTVKQNQGFVNVYSEPGQGTTFRIYLPRFMGKAVTPGTEISTVAPPVGSETVLIVEDEEAIMELSKTILEGLGYTVLTAGTPGKAIRLAGEYAGDIQLLITDVVMPEMNGRELSERLISINPGLKCLFMSGYTANAIAHHGVLDEGVHFIQKPFSIKAMAEKVRETLEN